MYSVVLLLSKFVIIPRNTKNADTARSPILLLMIEVKLHEIAAVK